AGRIIELWKEVLGVPSVRAGDNFLACGGDSISTARFLYLLRDETGVELPLREFLDDPTVEGVTATMSRLVAEGRHDPPRATVIPRAPRVPLHRPPLPEGDAPGSGEAPRGSGDTGA
ncbi:acyl carrier protein, partial [Streptomyces sp. FH025]|uniref:acyl carrier protein n=1 Tax=Streptomyces sp. FH025 TaxID=2815937 RepID=UPI001A9E408D